MKGRTLDLTIKQQCKVLAREAPNDRGTQRLATLEAQLETGILSDEAISTRNGRETRGLQPTGNAEAIKTERLGKVATSTVYQSALQLNGSAAIPDPTTSTCHVRFRCILVSNGQ